MISEIFDRERREDMGKKEEIPEEEKLQQLADFFKVFGDVCV